MIKLPEQVVSPQEIKFVISEIRIYARWLAQMRIKQQANGTADSAPPTISQPAIQLIRDWHTACTINQDSLDKLIASLEAFESTAPHITITLAAPPAGSLQKTLIAWFRTHGNPDALVIFRFNSTILGGMVIQYGSHIFDWSFRRQILEARSRLPEILRHV